MISDWDKFFIALVPAVSLALFYLWVFRDKKHENLGAGIQ